MTEQERDARTLQVLRDRLRTDRDATDVISGWLSIAVDRVASDGQDVVTIGAVVLYLQNLYTAVEQLLTRVASEIDGKVPSGDNWHRELLDQLNVEISGIRPPVLDADLYADLDLLRRFRHRVRHAYAAEYDWAEMQNVLAAAAALRVRLPRSLTDFDVWLQRTIEQLRHPPADSDAFK